MLRSSISSLIIVLIIIPSCAYENSQIKIKSSPSAHQQIQSFRLQFRTELISYSFQQINAPSSTSFYATSSTVARTLVMARSTFIGKSGTSSQLRLPLALNWFTNPLRTLAIAAGLSSSRMPSSINQAMQMSPTYLATLPFSSSMSSLSTNLKDFNTLSMPAKLAFCDRSFLSTLQINYCNQFLICLRLASCPKWASRWGQYLHLLFQNYQYWLLFNWKSPRMSFETPFVRCSLGVYVRFFQFTILASSSQDQQESSLIILPFPISILSLIMSSKSQNRTFTIAYCRPPAPFTCLNVSGSPIFTFLCSFFLLNQYSFRLWLNEFYLATSTLTLCYSAPTTPQNSTSWSSPKSNPILGRSNFLKEARERSECSLRKEQTLRWDSMGGRVSAMAMQGQSTWASWSYSSLRCLMRCWQAGMALNLSFSRKEFRIMSTTLKSLEMSRLRMIEQVTLNLLLSCSPWWSSSFTIYTASGRFVGSRTQIITLPFSSSPLRPALPDICTYSDEFRNRSTKLPVDSGSIFFTEWKITVRVGMFIPIAKVQVASNTFIRPSPNSSSTISFASGIRSPWWIAYPHLDSSRI